MMKNPLLTLKLGANIVWRCALVTFVIAYLAGLFLPSLKMITQSSMSEVSFTLLTPIMLYVISALLWFVLSRLKYPIWKTAFLSVPINWSAIYAQYAIVFLALAALNYVVAINFSAQVWKSWQLYGPMAVIVVFPFYIASGLVKSFIAAGNGTPTEEPLHQD